jgi:MraZ protein
MFIGEYSATIDDKGRIAIPVKFRSQLKSKVVITKGLDNSLFLLTVDEWKKLAEKWASLPIYCQCASFFPPHACRGHGL